MNKTYQDLVRTRAAAAVAEAGVIRGLHHNGLVGSLRETVLHQLLQPFLPPSMAIASGAVIDHIGAQSGQCDLIIYDRGLIPALLVKETGLIPLEATLAVIEVKSTLTMADLRQAQENCRRITGFTAIPGHFKGDGYDPDIAIPAPLRAVFAFDTDLSIDGKTELERFAELVPDLKERKLDQVCVVGRGFWFRRPVSSAELLPPGGSVQTEWVPWPRSIPLDEVIGFLAILHNTLPVISERRGRPRIGRYLAEF